MCKSVIRKLDDNGQITDLATYTLEPEKALVCYLEQFINKNYDTWKYFENFIDVAGKEWETKSKFIDLIKKLPSGRGYKYELSDGTVICAYEK